MFRFAIVSPRRSVAVPKRRSTRSGWSCASASSLAETGRTLPSDRCRRAGKPTLWIGALQRLRKGLDPLARYALARCVDDRTQVFVHARLLLLGNLVERIADLCSQHRCCRVSGSDVPAAAHKPLARSAIKRLGARKPRPLRSSKSSVQLNSLSLIASSSATRCVVPSASAPITTSSTRRSSAGPAPRWMPSAHKYARCSPSSRRCFHAVNSAPNSALTRAIVDAESGAVAPNNPRSVGSKSRCASPSIHSLMNRLVDRGQPSPILRDQRGRRMVVGPMLEVTTRSGC